MRLKDESKFEVISDAINRFWLAKGRIPSQKELSISVGIGKTAIFRCLKVMKSRGLIKGSGREISTPDTQFAKIPIVDTLHNSRHVYDEAELSNFVFVSKKIYGEGEIGIVRAIDDSMSKMNINPNNFIMVRRQQHAECGQIVLVKSNNKFLLRHLIYDNECKKSMLISESDSQYEDVTEYEICGVVLSVITHFDEDIVERYIQKLRLK